MRSKELYLIISCKYFQAMIQTSQFEIGSWKIIIMFVYLEKIRAANISRHWSKHALIFRKSHENIMISIISWEQGGFYAQLQHFLSTVWNAHGVQREPTQIFHILRKQRLHRPNISQNNTRSACMIHVFKIQSCKVQIQNYSKCFVSGQGNWLYLRKSGAAKFFRKSFEFVWIQYRPWKHQVMIICWENKDFKQQLSPEHFLNLYHKTPQPDRILIKSANHTFFTIAWIWGHVVNTCLLHFQVCGWSSGRKTHFETFSR